MADTHEAGIIRKISDYPTQDASIKSLFKLKIIIAHIIHDIIPELKEISCEELAEKYIDVSDDALNTPVSPYGSSAEILGINNESDVPGEGSVVFDVIFQVKLPNQTPKRYCLFIDLEGQGKLNPGYPLPKRAEFYVARLISRQLGSLADPTNYNRLQKVYSIWICYNDTPKAAQGSITKIGFQQECIYGNYRFPEEDTDLANIFFLILGKEKLGNQTLDFLWTLLKPNCTADERLKALETEYGIPMNEELAEEVRKMSGILNYHEEYGMEKGMEKGIRQGIKQGILAVHDILTAEELARRFQVSVSYVKNLLEENGLKAKESGVPNA